jgi:membrane protein DedA with SNARE-associated domain
MVSFGALLTPYFAAGMLGMAMLPFVLMTLVGIRS